jgi:type VI secretion system protein VasD
LLPISIGLFIPYYWSRRWRPAARRMAPPSRADSDILAGQQNKSAALTVRIYELKSEVSFQKADLLALQLHDKAAGKAASGANLLAQFSLRPGASRSLHHKSAPTAAAIGLLISYRDLPQTRWRVIYKLPPGPQAAWYRIALPAERIKLLVRLTASGARLTDRSTYGHRAPAAYEARH